MAADRYIDEAYCVAALGTGFVAAVKSLGIDLDQICESATSTIQKYMQNAGYSPISTREPSDVTDVTVKDAVLMAVWISLSQIPASSIKLPEKYTEHPAYLAYKGIVTGDIPLSGAPKQIGAVGGMQFANAATAVSTVQRSSRTNLVGY